MAAGWRRRLARISWRLLLFNLLLLILPLAGFLYLDTYERQLLDAQERAMVQQGRLLAAALGERGEVTREAAEALLSNLERRVDSRLRIVDAGGTVVADSSLLGPRLEPGEEARYADGGVRDEWLYRAGAAAARLLGRLAGHERGAGYPVGDHLGEEVDAALAGRYGTATRVRSAGGPALLLYSAIPIRSDGRVVGAAVVSQSTGRLLEDLYRLRRDAVRIVLASVVAAAVLSLLLAGTIARPLRRLRDQAERIVDRRGRLRGRFPASLRRDEIGDLARALERLTGRLERHLGFLEGFAADLAHELRNPLAAIRGATEVFADVDDPATRARFVEIVTGEVARMEAVLAAVRELVALDADVETPDESTDVADLVRKIVEGYRLRDDVRVELEVATPERALPVPVSEELLSQVVVNLIDNATSFAPPGSTVRVSAEERYGSIRLAVEDEGPGVPPEHRARVFERFFSYRPQDAGGEHLGLGLAIACAIVEAREGSLRLAESARGARFEVELPRA